MTIIIICCIFIAVIFGYLTGSVLFGVIFSKKYNKDIRSIGSKNPGATNVTRHLGKKIGILVAFCDASKSYLSVLILFFLFSNFKSFMNNDTDPYLVGLSPYIAGLFAVIGHCFPITYVFCLFRNKFNFEIANKKKGGKGVATAGGFMFAISPWIGLVTFSIWVITLCISRYVSIASIICMIFGPMFILIYVFQNFYMLHILYTNPMAGTFDRTIITPVLFFLMWVASMIVVYKHKVNLIRLHKHEEKKVSFIKFKK